MPLLVLSHTVPGRTFPLRTGHPAHIPSVDIVVVLIYNALFMSDLLPSGSVSPQSTGCACNGRVFQKMLTPLANRLHARYNCLQEGDSWNQN